MTHVSASVGGPAHSTTGHHGQKRTGGPAEYDQYGYGDDTYDYDLYEDVQR